MNGAVTFQHPDGVWCTIRDASRAPHPGEQVTLQVYDGQTGVPDEQTYWVAHVRHVWSGSLRTRGGYGQFQGQDTIVVLGDRVK